MKFGNHKVWFQIKFIVTYAYFTRQILKHKIVGVWIKMLFTTLQSYSFPTSPVLCLKQSLEYGELSLCNIGWQRARGQFGFGKIYRKLVFQRGLAHVFAGTVFVWKHACVNYVTFRMSGMRMRIRTKMTTTTTTSNTTNKSKKKKKKKK